MRVLKPMFIMMSGLLVAVTICSCSHRKSLCHPWKDTQADYYVVFNEDGTYRDSVYNVSLQYSQPSGNLMYYTAAGDAIYVEPDWTVTGNLRLYIGGKYRELKPVENVSSMFNWTSQDTFRKRNSKEHYELKSAIGIQSELYIKDDNTYQYSIEYAGDIAGDSVQGLVAVSDDYRDYALYYDNGEYIAILRASPLGLYLASSPMECEGELIVEKSYANQSLQVERGYLIDGIVSTKDSAVDYVFTTDSRCVKSTPSGNSVTYTYYISTEGLVTLLPVDGVIDTDYLYYDYMQGVMYRMVYQRDSWYDYVSELGSINCDVDDSTVDWTVPATIALPDNRCDVLSANATVTQYTLCEAMSFVDEDYTRWCANTVKEHYTRLQYDTGLQEQYEEMRNAERERLKEQIIIETRERSRAKAVMDARVEAEIANGVSHTATPPTVVSLPSATESSDDLSWLDAFLASLDNKPSYDQDANSSSPVVNMGDENLPETPVTAAPTDSPIVSEEESGTEVSQYDPAFYVDFVCTCVNCHVQALPVELNSDNVLLVDASVIEPGTYLSLEGYGMVVARASDGYTSGQTAVCYSNSHNAVNRFSSGTYNVYKVVG